MTGRLCRLVRQDHCAPCNSTAWWAAGLVRTWPKGHPAPGQAADIVSAGTSLCPPSPGVARVLRESFLHQPEQPAWDKTRDLPGSDWPREDWLGRVYGVGVDQDGFWGCASGELTTVTFARDAFDLRVVYEIVG